MRPDSVNQSKVGEKRSTVQIRRPCMALLVGNFGPTEDKASVAKFPMRHVLSQYNECLWLNFQGRGQRVGQTLASYASVEMSAGFQHDEDGTMGGI